MIRLNHGQTTDLLGKAESWMRLAAMLLHTGIDDLLFNQMNNVKRKYLRGENHPRHKHNVRSYGEAPT